VRGPNAAAHIRPRQQERRSLALFHLLSKAPAARGRFRQKVEQGNMRVTTRVMGQVAVVTTAIRDITGGR
jgi:hypothetical protein